MVITPVVGEKPPTERNRGRFKEPPTVLCRNPIHFLVLIYSGLFIISRMYYFVNLYRFWIINMVWQRNRIIGQISIAFKRCLNNCSFFVFTFNFKSAGAESVFKYNYNISSVKGLSNKTKVFYVIAFAYFFDWKLSRYILKISLPLYSMRQQPSFSVFPALLQ